MPVTTNYFVTGFNESSTNLIVNGDFSAGKSGFTSNYTYPKPQNSTCLQPEGYYVVGTNPQAYHPNFSTCVDHTSGSGNMMIVNGNTIANSKVWGQDITVKPNTWYAFYAYLTPVHKDNPPILQFSINGSVIGNPFSSSGLTCSWQKFYAVWYSGSITNANISIVNQNTIASGNDFALDDIKFVELCTATNKVTVTVGPLTSTTNISTCTTNLPYNWNGSDYNASGTYTKHLSSVLGCDSIATLNLIVNVPTASTTNATICQGGSYLFNGTTYNTAGTYTKTLINAAGCDSIATLNLTVNASTSSTTSASICQGSPYTFNGSTYNTAGTYSKTLINAAGCDSIATLNLTVNVPTSSSTNASICQGSSYTFNGTTYNTAGTYTKTLINAAGCDSIATLVLSEKLPTSSTATVSICTADFPYVWNSSSYATAGAYTKIFANVAGCDSIATLVLSEKLPTSSTTSVSICTADFPYVWNSISYATAGTYTKTFTNVAGCDSIATLVLSEKLPTSSTTSISICTDDFPYVWNSISYATAGTYTKTFTNVAGCDSIATLVLSEKLPTNSTTMKTICSSELPYLWNGLMFNVGGRKSVRLQNSVGCDSIANLELTVNDITSSVTEITTCPLALPFIWNGIPYNSAGKYTVQSTNSKGCDSIATLILNVKTPLTSTATEYICSSLLPYSWNKKLYFKSGIYTTQLVSSSGCDSVATLVLNVVTPSSSTSRESVNSTELPYVWNKLAFTESGTYVSPYKYVNSMGCDSIAKLILRVNLSTSAETYASVCASDIPYIWNGTPYYNAGTFTKIMTNALGEDVTVTLHLTIVAPQTTTQSIRIFSGETYSINGHDYDKEGIYSDNLKNVNGCDSTVVTELSFINIPNTITPNGDGHNDFFMAGWHTKIFNRNGILLYDGTEGWNGSYNNKPVSKDTYFYVLYYTSGTRTKSKEGYLMVIP